MPFSIVSGKNDQMCVCVPIMQSMLNMIGAYYTRNERVTAVLMRVAFDANSANGQIVCVRRYT